MTEKHKIWWVYSTFATQAEALSVATKLLEEKRIACANVMPGLTSVYRWEGKVQTQAECGLVMKTSAPAVPALIERLKHLHSYELPCIMATPLEAGYEPFMQWVVAETI